MEYKRGENRQRVTDSSCSYSCILQRAILTALKPLSLVVYRFDRLIYGESRGV